MSVCMYSKSTFIHSLYIFRLAYYTHRERDIYIYIFIHVWQFCIRLMCSLYVCSHKLTFVLTHVSRFNNVCIKNVIKYRWIFLYICDVCIHIEGYVIHTCMQTSSYVSRKSPTSPARGDSMQASKLSGNGTRQGLSSG